MLHKLLEDVETIINTLACNDKQPIEIRGAFNAAINLRAALEQVSAADMSMPEVKEEVKEEPTKWIIPNKEDKKGKE